jgi:hypothetical protein
VDVAGVLVETAGVGASGAVTEGRAAAGATRLALSLLSSYIA